MDKLKPNQTTVIICAAGMGTRLGIGTTKALVDIDGIPLILRQLELLRDFDDIRIVVGFQAEKLINVVKEYRKDIMFAFNYEFETSGVADSLRKGMVAARDYILSLDGDILVNPNDFVAFLSGEVEVLGVSEIKTAEPVKAIVKDGIVTRLSKSEGNMQWPGIARLKKEKFQGSSPHVYDVLNGVLPLPAFTIRTREIDTQEDYDQAIEWFVKGQVD